MSSTISLTIDGVSREILYGWALRRTVNGQSTFQCNISSKDATYRPALDDEVLLEVNGTRVFGGFITSPRESGILNESGVPIVTNVTAADFNVLADRRYLTEVIAAGTLKHALLQVVGWLEGVTLNPAQVDGPALGALAYYDVKTREVLNDLTALSGGYLWSIDSFKVLTMMLPGTVAAPVNVTQSNGVSIGDVTVEPVREGYANNIIVRSNVARVGANDAAEQAAHGIWSLVVTVPDTTSVPAMTAIANSILAQSLPILKMITYTTRNHGIAPGQTQTVVLPRRNLNNTFLITDVDLAGSDSGHWYQVSAIEGTTWRNANWREVYKQWSGGRSNAGVAGGSVGVNSVFTRYAYFLGGNGIDATQSAASGQWVPAAGGDPDIGEASIHVQIDTAVTGTAAATVVTRLRALDAGVSVQARLYDVTLGAAVPGLSAVVTSTVWETAIFGVTLTNGNHFYELQLLPSVGGAPVLGTGYIEMTSGFGTGTPPPITSHHTTHETGGADAISVLNAAVLTSGTIPDARFPAVLPAVSGANLTGITTDAGDLDIASLPALGAAANDDRIIIDDVSAGVIKAIETQNFLNRLPIAHASTHNVGGSDQLVLDVGVITSGAFAKARQHAQTAYKDETNIFTLEQEISASLSVLKMRGTAGAVNARLWRIATDGATLYFQPMLDDSSGATTALALTRAGILVLSGGQISFPATQIPSSDPNTLDDYEEGSWVPSLAGTTSQSGQSYAVQDGWYVKTGKFVHAAGYIQLSALGTITGNVLIAGLPFVSSGHTGRATFLAAYAVGLNVAVSCIGGYINPSAANATMTYFPAAGATGVTIALQATLTSSLAILFNIDYEAAN